MKNILFLVFIIFTIYLHGSNAIIFWLIVMLLMDKHHERTNTVVKEPYDYNGLWARIRVGNYE